MSAKRKAKMRKAQARAARSDRFAFVTVSVDRSTNQIAVDHPWISAPEARGVLETALDTFEDTAMRDLSALEDEDGLDGPDPQ